MVSRAPEERYPSLHNTNSPRPSNPNMTRHHRKEKESYHQSCDWEHPLDSLTVPRSNISPPHSRHHVDVIPTREHYYRPTPIRERTPSPPREYSYGTNRQREWHDYGYEGQEFNDDADDEPYPEQPQDRRPVPRNSSRHHEQQEEERFRRRQEEEHRWLQEEDRRRRWEVEERYRRWEEQELRRYEQDKIRRHQEEIRKQEEQRRCDQAQHLPAEEERHRQHMTELTRPSDIPKPPPPHPGFESTHSSQQWALLRKNSQRSCVSSRSNKSPKDEKISLVRSSYHASSGHSSGSKDSSVWKAPYPFFSSEQSEDQHPKALHLCKTVCSDDSLKAPPIYPILKKEDSSSHCGRVGAFQESGSSFKTSSSHFKKTSSHSHSHGHLKKGSDSTLSSSTASHQPKKQTLMVEIQPGFSLPLRGSQETLEAVLMGQVLETPCMACCTWIVVRADCDFVICPECRVVSPVEGGPCKTSKYVGLGMTQAAHEATVARHSAGCS